MATFTFTSAQDFINVWTELDKAYGYLAHVDINNSLITFGHYDNGTAVNATAIPVNPFADTVTAFGQFGFILQDSSTTAGELALAVNLAFIKLGDAYVQWLEAGNAPILDQAKDRGAGTLGQSYHDNILGNLSDGAIGDRFNPAIANNLHVDVTGDSVDDIVVDPRAWATKDFAGDRPYFVGNATNTSARAGVIAHDQAHGLFYAYSDMSLQAVINAADAGDTIFLANGIYTLASTLNIHEGVKIVGESQSGVILDAHALSHGYGILVDADHVSISNLTVLGPHGSVSGVNNQTGGSAEYGINVQAGHRRVGRSRARLQARKRHGDGLGPLRG